MENNPPSVTVSWEIAKYILPAAQTGDETALLLLCKLANPAWNDVAQADFKSEALGGGFSGNVPIKCTAAGKSGALALKINLGSEPDSLVNAAYQEFDKAGIVPKLYCLGNPSAPGLEVYDFVPGGTAAWLISKHGPEFLENEDDAVAYGQLLAKLHSCPSEWYEQYKDHCKGQWEPFFVDAETNLEAKATKEALGDYAYLAHLWSDFITRLGPNAAAMGEGVKELSPLLNGLLEPGSLMGRWVVGHGDAHGCNSMHKTEGGHGDLLMIDLDFVGRFPAAVDLGTVFMMSMRSILGYFFGAGTPVGEWATLDQRRSMAQAYIDQMGDAAKDFTRNTVDEVVYDMEIGNMMRTVQFMCPITAPLNFNVTPLRLGWQFLHLGKAGFNLLEKAKTDDSTKQAIMEKGLAQIVIDKLVEAGCTPAAMSAEQFEQQWDVCGNLGPTYSQAMAQDDTPPSTEGAQEPEPSSMSSFQAATLRYHASTGADLTAVFQKFDLDADGLIDVYELMRVAMVCGAGFKDMTEAEEAMVALDTDGDGKLGVEEFKQLLHAK